MPNIKSLILLIILGFTNQQSTDIIFDLVDLSTNYYDSEIGTIFLEAFKSSKNDLIINKKDVDNYGQLKWLSIGYPNLVKTFNNTSKKYELFLMKPEGFDVAIEMLTERQRKLFVELVKNQYKIDINSNQILSLIPAEFSCQLFFTVDNRDVLINGKVNQLTRLPYKLTFQAPLKSKERIYFEERINKDKENLDLEISCQIYSQGKAYRENTLIIKGEQINQISLVEEIFGDGSEKYVSRNQMSSLSSNLYLKLNIIEDYQITESKFRESFVDDFIKQTYSVIIDKYVSFDEALSKLSKYDLSEDLKPTVLKSEYSKLFYVNKTGSKEFLQLNKTQYEKLNTQSDSNSQSSLKSRYKLFSISGSVNYANNQKSEWEKLNIEFINQLSDLNSYTENEIEWARSGNIVIPKSLKVSRLSRSNFNKDLTFVRVKKEYYDAPYKKKVYMDTKSSLTVSQEVLDNAQKLIQLEQKTKEINESIINLNQTSLLVYRLLNQSILDQKVLSQNVLDNRLDLDLYRNYTKQILDNQNKTFIQYIKIVGNDAIGRKWENGKISPSCKSYKNPSDLYVYQGDTGSGLYWISPNSNEDAFMAYCDMETDGGGWTFYYTTDNLVHVASFSKSNPISFKTNGYYADLRNLPFTDVLYVRISDMSKDWFKQKIFLTVNNYIKTNKLFMSAGTVYSNFEPFGGAKPGRYQLTLSDYSYHGDHGYFSQGLMISGVDTGNWDRSWCDSKLIKSPIDWCWDTVSNYYRSATGSAIFNGVCFRENGNRNCGNILMSVGIR